jgi:propanediol dehydratase small subunit
MAFIAILVSLVTLLALSVLWAQRYGGYMPEPYRSRPCQGSAWKRTFPNSSSDEIRRFLHLFAQAFGYRKAQMLQVGPNDKVVDVYRAQHPQTGGVDGLELETLAATSEKRYSINFGSIWSEALTFGALFAACQESMPKASGVSPNYALKRTVRDEVSR